MRRRVGSTGHDAGDDDDDDATSTRRQLPIELVIHVLEYSTDIADLCAARRVNKTWATAAAVGSVWESLCIAIAGSGLVMRWPRDHQISPQPATTKTTTTASSAHRSSATADGSIGLRTLEMGSIIAGSRSGHAFLASMLSTFSRSVRLHAATDAALTESMPLFRRIRVLSVSHGFQLSRQVIRDIPAHLPDLRYLNLSHTLATAREICGIIDCCTRLEGLDLSSCPRLSSHGIERISSMFASKAVVLKLNGSWHLSSDSCLRCLKSLATAPLLTKFEIRGCGVVDVDALTMFVSKRVVEALPRCIIDVRDCELLTGDEIAGLNAQGHDRVVVVGNPKLRNHGMEAVAEYLDSIIGINASPKTAGGSVSMVDVSDGWSPSPPVAHAAS